jgi:hypothetical protein
VVLSSQRVDTRQALFNTMKGKEQAKNDAANPLVNSSGKLIPSVTRVFRRGRDLEVFLQAYWGNITSAATTTSAGSAVTRTAAGDPKVVAFVSLFHNGAKVMDGQAVQATVLSQNRLGATPIDLKLSLEGVEAGEYQCQVTVLDPTKDRAAFWQGSLAIIY